MDGTTLCCIFDRHQQAYYANDFSDFNFYGNGNFKQQVIEKIWKFKDNLKLLIKENDGENQTTSREIRWFVLNDPPLTSTNNLKGFLSQKLVVDIFLSYYLILSCSTCKKDKDACIISKQMVLIFNLTHAFIIKWNRNLTLCWQQWHPKHPD